MNVQGCYGTDSVTTAEKDAKCSAHLFYDEVGDDGRKFNVVCVLIVLLSSMNLNVL